MNIKELKELKELKDKLECFLKNIDELEMEEIHSKIVCFINDLETEEEKEFDFEKWKKELEEFKKSHNHHIIITQKIGYKCTTEEYRKINEYANYKRNNTSELMNVAFLYNVEIIIDDENPIGFFIIEEEFGCNIPYILSNSIKCHSIENCINKNTKYWPKYILYGTKCLNFKEKQKFNEPWEPKLNERYFYIKEDGRIERAQHVAEKLCCRRIDTGNCFKTEEEAEQRAKEIKVYNLLKNFSDANRGDEIDWKDLSKLKYFIYFDFEIEKNRISFNYDKTVGVVYFISEEVAEEALKKYQKELEELVR